MLVDNKRDTIILVPWDSMIKTWLGIKIYNSAKWTREINLFTAEQHIALQSGHIIAKKYI